MLHAGLDLCGDRFGGDAVAVVQSRKGAGGKEGVGQADLVKRWGEARAQQKRGHGLAEAAGLGKAFAEFPEDVAAALAQARNTAGAIRQPEDPAAEPWPPMRAGGGL